MTRATVEIPWGAANVMRTIEERDLETLRRWRNGDRQWFGDVGEITAEKQAAWFAAYLERENDVQFILESAGRPVGTVALYSINEPIGEAEYGRLIIDRDARRLGYAVMASGLLLRWAWQTYPKLSIIRLYVKDSNRAALVLYQRIGFDVAGADGNLVRMELVRGQFFATVKGAHGYDFAEASDPRCSCGPVAGAGSIIDVQTCDWCARSRK